MLLELILPIVVRPSCTPDHDGTKKNVELTHSRMRDDRGGEGGGMKRKKVSRNDKSVLAQKNADDVDVPR